MSVATVTIAGGDYRATGSSPVVFGRADAPGVVGLDPQDMGISAVAGSVEWKGLWLVVNRSGKRKLYISDGTGVAPQVLDCGHSHVVNVTRLTIRVRGEILSHTVVVTVPESDLTTFQASSSSTGTLIGEISLTGRDRRVCAALFEGYLLPFPRFQPWPRTYEEAAQRLGSPWTRDKVRKQVERLKTRLRRTGPPLDGPRANNDLADYLLTNDVLGPHDLELLR